MSKKAARWVPPHGPFFWVNFFFRYFFNKFGQPQLAQATPLSPPPPPRKYAPTKQLPHRPPTPPKKIREATAWSAFQPFLVATQYFLGGGGGADGGGILTVKITYWSSVQIKPRTDPAFKPDPRLLPTIGNKGFRCPGSCSTVARFRSRKPENS